MIYIPPTARDPRHFSATPWGEGRSWTAHHITMTSGPPAVAHRPAQAPQPRLIDCIRIHPYTIAYHPKVAIDSTSGRHAIRTVRKCYEYRGIDPGMRNLSNEYHHPTTQQNLFFVAFVYLLAFLPLASLPPNCIFIRLGPLGLV